MGTPRRAALVLGAVLALVLPTAGAMAAPSDALEDIDIQAAPAAMEQSGTGRYFIQLDSDPIRSGGEAATIAAEQEAFLDGAEAANMPADVAAAYEDLFNGFSVKAPAQTAAAYAALPGVTAVFPVYQVHVSEPIEVSPQPSNTIAMTGADVAQSELGHLGTGVSVGIIGTGVDFNHPDLGGSGAAGDLGDFPNDRVTAGHDFVGDAYDADPASPTFNPVPEPDEYPGDCNGHGTHVAGIVGANGEVTGVAPDVEIGAYRVAGCEGGTDTQMLLSALEMAAADGMDVINVTLGARLQSWPDYPTTAAADALVEEGIVVVAPVGDDGASYTQTAGSPASGHGVIGVASYDTAETAASELLVTSEESDQFSTGYLQAAGAPALTAAIDGAPLARMDDPLGCTPNISGLAGSVALIGRGTCTFYQKALNAMNAGARAAVIYNNTSGTFNATVLGTPRIEIPVVAIVQEDGRALADLLDGGATTSVTVTGESVDLRNPTGGLVSGFSSWGLAADLTLKPDLGAPGDSIRSTYPLEHGSYATLSGTSLAAAHVAGGAALLIEAIPDISPAQVLARLQGTAEPSQFSLAPQLGILDAPHHQGGGLIRIDTAITTDIVVTPGKISAGESADGPHAETITIANYGDEAATYHLSNVNAVATAVDTEAGEMQNTPGFLIGETVVEMPPSVTIVAGAQVDVVVTITADQDLPEFTQYGGYILLTPEGEGNAQMIPYAGMKGDYLEMPTLTGVADVVLPSLGALNCALFENDQCVDVNGSAAPTSGSHVYAIAGNDFPTVLAHLGVPAENVSIEVRTAGPGGRSERLVATILDLDRLGRDSGISAWVWDGTAFDSASGEFKPVPDGRYTFRMVVRHADDGRGSETWTSPAFEIARNGNAD